MSTTQKRDYIEWITEAKREATVQKRVATAVEWIAEGKGRNWKYEPQQSTSKKKTVGRKTTSSTKMKSTKKKTSTKTSLTDSQKKPSKATQKSKKTSRATKKK